MNSFDFEKQITIDGMACLIRSNFTGCLCGYVAIPSSSKLFKLKGNEDHLPSFDVHGGIIYTGEIKDELIACEWAIGFDCAHLGDAYHPEYVEKMGLHFGMRSPIDTWKDEAYVTKELQSLVRQIKEYENKNEPN